MVKELEFSTKIIEGDESLLGELEIEINKILSVKKTQYSIYPGYAIFDAWTIVANHAYSSGNLEILKKTFRIFTSAYEKKPYLLPHSLDLHYLLGADGIRHLIHFLEIGFANAPIKGVRILEKGTADKSSYALQLLTSTIERIFAYKEEIDSMQEIAIHIQNLKWNDDKLWVLFYTIKEIQFSEDLKNPVVANLFLPLLAKGDGEGKKKLEALLKRHGHSLGKSKVQAIHLPDVLPNDPSNAMALLKEWKIGSKELKRIKPASEKKIKELSKKLKVKIPDELEKTLLLHESIGDIEFGPLDRMIALREDIKEILEEHLKEEEIIEFDSDEYRDVRDYNPLTDGIPVGTNTSGDIFFLATNAKSSFGNHPIIRFHHNEALTSSIESNSLGEYISLIIAKVFAEREGMMDEYYKLSNQKRKITIK